MRPLQLLSGKVAVPLLSVLLISSPLFGAGPTKPACTSENRGRFWPEKANSDHAALSAFTRSGELEMCVGGFFHGHWERLAITYKELVSRAVKSESHEATAAVVEEHP